MKVHFKAEVDAKVVDVKRQHFMMDDEFEVFFKFGERFLSHIILSRELSESEVGEVVADFEESDHPDKAGSMTVSLPGNLYEKAVEKIQLLESYLGLRELKRIRWDEVEVKLIPETESDEDQTDILGWSIFEQESDRPRVWDFDPKNANWNRIRELKVPLAFYRKATQFMIEQDFVNSFINFYFILEGFYSDGQFRNVEEKFLDSDELLYFVQTMWDGIEDKLLQDMEDLFEFYDKEKSPEGFIKLIVTIRHQLSHFFHDHSGPHTPSPFEDKEYRPIAVAMKSITFLVLIYREKDFEVDTEKV